MCILTYLNAQTRDVMYNVRWPEEELFIVSGRDLEPLCEK